MKNAERKQGLAVLNLRSSGEAGRAFDDPCLVLVELNRSEGFVLVADETNYASHPHPLQTRADHSHVGHFRTGSHCLNLQKHWA